MDQRTQTKTCSKCGETKPLTDFHKLTSGADGRQYKCKTCALALARARHIQKRDEILAYRARYRQANPEQIAAYRRQYREHSADKHYAAIRAWHLRHPEVRAEFYGRRRARIAESTIGPIDLDALWTGACGICHEPMERPAPAWPAAEFASVDHIIPIARGGPHTQDNLQWAHLSCNLRKGAS